MGTPGDMEPGTMKVGDKPEPVAQGNPRPDEVLDASHDSAVESAPQPPAPETEKPLPETGFPKKTVRWSSDLVMDSPSSTIYYSSSSYPSNNGPNSYVAPHSPTSFTSLKDTVGTVRDVLGRWGKMVGEVTKKAEDLAGNTWQHLKTSPSFTDAAMGRIAAGTKVLAEGGYEKIFRQTFEMEEDELLQDSFACYLSTSAGPVMGILYISSLKMAFCSDNPLSYKAHHDTQWSYYKVIIPLNQLKAVNPSVSRANPAEKYVQVISVDNHEFWYMGFLNYNGAVKCLEDAFQAHYLQSIYKSL